VGTCPYDTRDSGAEQEHRRTTRLHIEVEALKLEWSDFVNVPFSTGQSRAYSVSSLGSSTCQVLVEQAFYCRTDIGQVSKSELEHILDSK
jgi:hypothetical protein